MNLSRLKYLLLAVGLLAAGGAQAATITVYAQMSGSPTVTPIKAVGQVDVQSGTTTPAIACQTGAAAGCVADAALASTVVLRPSAVVEASAIVPNPNLVNAVFVSWSGCSSVSSDGFNDCTVNVTGAKTVYAVFAPAYYALNLKTLGTAGSLATAGALTVGDCQSGAGSTHTTCNLFAANGAAVAITATPSAGQKVTAWSGCTPVDADPVAAGVQIGPQCAIPAMSASRVVSATFGAANIPVTAQVQGLGRINVTAGGAVTDGMACGNGGADCAAQVAPNGTISFTAVAGAGMKFIGWTGCSSATATCSKANVTAPFGVTATFMASNCNSCHGTPPPTHVGLVTTNCGDCHTGYTADSVNAPVHMNGVVTASNSQQVAPAGFGFELQVVGAGFDGVAKPWVELTAKDASGVTLNISTLITNNEFTSSTGSSRIPRFAFGEILADGSFVTRLAPVSSPATGVGSNPQNIPTVSETSTSARFTATATPGVVRYTFGTSGQAGLDLSKTFRVVVYGARFFKPAAPQASVQYPSSDFLDFVPAGGTPVAGKEVVSDAACNTCHGALTLHGMRRGVAVCLTCHNPNTGLGGSLVTTTLPTGRAPKAASVWDLKNLVHRLHSGKNDVAWGTTFDASAIKMAPSHKLYFEGGNTVAGTGLPLVAVIDPELTIECGVCHQGGQANNYATKPSRAACTSCHVDTDPWTGTNHDGGIAANDATCFACHPESGAITPGAVYPVKAVHGAYYEPAHNFNFAALSGFPADGHKFAVTLVNVTADATGKPTFTVDVSLDGAPFDIKGVLTTPSTTVGRVATCAFQIAGPTTDYVVPATGGTAVSCTSGAAWTFVSSTATSSRFTFTPATGTFFAGVPAGYYTAAFEIMWQRVAQATNGDYVRKPFSANPNFLTVKRNADNTAAVVTDPVELATQSRRTVVEFSKCNACHEDIGFHSNRGRKGPDYCATCHNPKLDNFGRARITVAESTTIPGTSTPGYLPESVSMNVFIHRIHMGADLPSVATPTSASPWVPDPGKILYGATRSAFTGLDATTPPDRSDFSKFAMPNPMANCDQCHISAGAKKTWALNESAGLAPVERTWKVCNAATPTWATEPWCEVTATSGMPTTGAGVAAAIKVYTPPLKAACTSCHDGLGTDQHADMNTTSPMTAGAIEHCASCHGAGKAFDSVVVHQPVP